MNDPAWQAITPEVVSPSQHAPAVALNSVGFNVARAVGPALGGMVIAVAGSGVAFLLNALSFFGVIFFLYRWKRPHFGGHGNRAGAGRDSDRLAVCAGRAGGAVCADSHRRVQPGRECVAGAAAAGGASAWRQRVWTAAGIFRTGSIGRSVGAASAAQPAFGGRSGGIRDCGVCGDDVCRGPGAATSAG